MQVPGVQNPAYCIRHHPLLRCQGLIPALLLQGPCNLIALRLAKIVSTASSINALLLLLLRGSGPRDSCGCYPDKPAHLFLQHRLLLLRSMLQNLAHATRHLLQQLRQGSCALCVATAQPHLGHADDQAA
jgi:hypothetical protein